MDSALIRAESEFNQNCLKLNMEKTHKIVFSTTVGVAQGNSLSILGIHLNDGLRWSAHTFFLEEKLSSAVSGN